MESRTAPFVRNIIKIIPIIIVLIAFALADIFLAIPAKTAGADDFVFTVNTTIQDYSGSNRYNFILTDYTDPDTGTVYTNNINIDWGDGSSDSGVSSTILHTYATGGIYTIRVSGTYHKPTIGVISSYADEDKVISIDQWGTQPWKSFLYACHGCVNLEVNATDMPDLSNVKSMYGAFSQMKNFTNTSINNWDVSNVQDMRFLFQGSDFNQPIGNWDVSSVTEMRSMFDNALFFNQDLTNWNTVNVIDMRSMFYEAVNFNGDVSNWDTSNVDVFAGTFRSASSFNQPLNSWDVSSATNMSYMFYGASSFNQPLTNWDVSSVQDFGGMFSGSAFLNEQSNYNQDISMWDVSGALSLDYMFRDNYMFNQDIGNWDVSNVTDIGSMFKGAQSFNQDLSCWDTSRVTNMYGTFSGALSFNNSLGDWDVSSATEFTDFIGGTGLSTANYDALLIGWDQQILGVTGVDFYTGGSLTYCSGASARSNIIANYS